MLFRSGICNSGGSLTDASSYVEAWVINDTPCESLTVYCSCTVSYAISTTVPGSVGRGGGLAKGTVLDASFYDIAFPSSIQDGKHPDQVQVAALAGAKAASQSFPLKSKERHQLYHGTININTPGENPGSGFTESMNGKIGRAHV